MVARKSPLIVSVPYGYYLEPLRQQAGHGSLGDVHLVPWRVADDLPNGLQPADIDLVILPFQTTSDNPSEEYESIRTLRRDLPRATNARLIQAISIGVEGLSECLPARTVLANAAGVMEPPTAELAVTLLLTLLREIPEFLRSMGTWDNRRTKGLMGARVLLLGYGGVGQATAQRLNAFGAVVVPVAQTARTLDSGVVVHGVDEAHALLGDVDAVVCTLPLSETTTDLIDAAFIEALPVGAAVVNVGRGAVVNTNDLIAAARSGKITAALDVTEPEPLPHDHPLWNTPGVFVTPHVGGNTDAAVRLQVDLLAEQIRRVGSGDKPLNIVQGEWA